MNAKKQSKVQINCRWFSPTSLGVGPMCIGTRVSPNPIETLLTLLNVLFILWYFIIIIFFLLCLNNYIELPSSSIRIPQIMWNELDGVHLSYKISGLNNGCLFLFYMWFVFTIVAEQNTTDANLPQFKKAYTLKGMFVWNNFLLHFISAVASFSAENKNLKYFIFCSFSFRCSVWCKSQLEIEVITRVYACMIDVLSMTWGMGNLRNPSPSVLMSSLTISSGIMSLIFWRADPPGNLIPPSYIFITFSNVSNSLGVLSNSAFSSGTNTWTIDLSAYARKSDIFMCPKRSSLGTYMSKLTSGNLLSVSGSVNKPKTTVVNNNSKFQFAGLGCKNKVVGFMGPTGLQQDLLIKWSWRGVRSKIFQVLMISGHFMALVSVLKSLTSLCGLPARSPPARVWILFGPSKNGAGVCWALVWKA